MAGILDEVMDGIAAKEGGQTPPTTPAPTTPPATPPKQEQSPATTLEAKPMHTYSDDFKNKYGGEKNNVKKT